MNKANIFMNAGWAGLVGLGLFFSAAIDSVPIAVALTGGLIFVAACWVMMFTRNVDEYTRGLWTSGTSVAFATMLILFFALPSAEGFYDGFTHALFGGDEPTQDIPAITSIMCAIVGFYIGLFWKRFRGV